MDTWENILNKANPEKANKHSYLQKGQAYMSSCNWKKKILNTKT